MVSPPSYLRTAMLAVWLAACASTVASATPVTWVLSAASFSGGASLSGSFVYDADTNNLANVAVTSGGDADFAGSLYTVSNPSFGPYDLEFTLLPSVVADATGIPVLDMQFFLPLTDAGGVVSFAVNEYACGDAGCTFPSAAYRFGEGTLTATSLDLPEPANGILLGAGFLLTGLVRRQKRTREPIRNDGPGVW